MVSTRSKTRANTATVVSQSRQSGIAAFARTGKSGAGLSAAAVTAEKTTLARTRNVGKKEVSQSVSRLVEINKRKFQNVEDRVISASKRLRTVGENEDSGVEVPGISQGVSTKTAQSTATTRLRARRGISILASAVPSSSQDAATETPYLSQSTSRSSQDLGATRDTTLTCPSPSPYPSPEPESNPSVERGDVLVGKASTGTDLLGAETNRENQASEVCEAILREHETDSNLAKEEDILRSIRPDATDHCDDGEKETLAINLDNEDGARPSCYYDLVSLYSSFLTALSFHYAHNNLSAPADLKELLPCIEKIWKKRQVLIGDFRKMVHIANHRAQDGEGPGEATVEYSKREGGHGGRQYLTIVNYGHGRTCLELANPPESNPFSPPINKVEELATEFRKNLEMLWQSWRHRELQNTTPSTDNTARLANHDFYSHIPLGTLHTSTNSFITPNVGRQRLLEFTEGSLRLRSLQSSDSTIRESAVRLHRSSRKSLASTSSSGTLTRKSSLLQRIRDKETQSSKLPPPPTPEQSLRIAAGQHMDEVRGILRCMRPTQAKMTPQRRAYRWDEAVGNVVQSLKMPISKKEVEVCLTMIAEDVKCGWVKIAVHKDVKTLVLMSGGLNGWISFSEKKVAVDGRKEMKKDHRY
ncbi:hypothetical protein KEM54_006395 [Ascosphaera aggregata]|nr:hypothetical protein KEM54_006395 [Ascosphaera aggregata]